MNENSIPVPIHSTEPQSFAIVRLGADSTEAIAAILNGDGTPEPPFSISISCKQVPKELSIGTFAFVWLGTNNNKGGATPWLQGLRALGVIESIEGGPNYNDEKTVRISIGIVLKESLTKKDFIRITGEKYIRISDLPVVGINNYSSQVIQRIDPSDDSQQVAVLVRAIDELAPGFSGLIAAALPEMSVVLATYAEPNARVQTLAARVKTDTRSATYSIDIPKDDPIFNELFARVSRLLKDGFGGVILRGPPGTSKSWYARRIAAELAGRSYERMRFVQFHPSYQYEDFVEGFIPNANGTFSAEEKHFLKICRAATEDPTGTYVLVVDELSRTDPARVFGEALTYLESSKRGEEFSLASGRQMQVPSNLLVIATMNVWDRGIDEVDAAVERRFASIAMNPDRDALLRILDGNAVDEQLRDRVVRLFDCLQKDPNPLVRIGHAYFHGVRDESSVHRLWNHQLKFQLERAFPLEQDGFARVERLWTKLFPAGEQPTTRQSISATDADVVTVA
jgi:5-methylcytosine-specific restriction enzyme B